MDSNTLNQKFAVENKVRFQVGKGGLDKIVINAKSKAEIYLHGAHVTSFVKNGRERLWLSSKAVFQNDKAIRGGIPICWPWFGKHRQDPTLPQHGYARISKFDVESVSEKDDETITVKLSLDLGDRPLSMFPFKSKLEVTFEVAERLTISLTTFNRDEQAFPISEAIHSYFSVSDIHQTVLAGLDSVKYYDQLEAKEYNHAGELFFIGETDNIFGHSEGKLNIKEHGQITTQIQQFGADSTVVWNPWVEKSKSMSDFPDDGYLSMLCIEAANTAKDNLIQPGESRSITQVIG